MKRWQKLQLLKHAFHIAGADKILLGFVAFFLVDAFVIWLVEPGITTYTDAIWFCFASATTIGYGDLTAVTLTGRIMTIILSVYALAATAIFTAVVTSFFLDYAKKNTQDSVYHFLDQLEHLSELSPNQLEELSKQVKIWRRNQKI